MSSKRIAGGRLHPAPTLVKETIMALVELKNVSKTYREPGGAVEVSVLRDVNWQVEAGSSVAIVGPSGCGKF